MLQARLRKTFPQRPDSSGFSLDLEFKAAAGVTVLFGPSGSGKTQVLDSIAGFTRPDEGRILLDDDLLFDAATGVHLPPQARNCGYVFQNYALFPHMTLRQNLMFAAERRPRLERHRRVNEMLETFRLTEAAGRRPHEVSGGQRQRCSIARALIVAPKLLLLDEPGQGLDAPLKADFYEVLRQVRADFKTPVLLVTHDLDECFELGEEMLILRDGRIVQTGSPRKILDQPANVEVARLLGAFNLIPCEIRALDPGRNTSKVQMGDVELDGPYFPGRFKGDRVTLCVRPEQLVVSARLGRPGANQIAAELKRAVEKPYGMRLEFEGGIVADMGRAEFERVRENKDWLIEFPAPALRVI
ncbi:MAG TPA: ABC transporter ATP-binding protein [Bryobacteraceae bacterium]|jgi:ABC-type sulfate/molybdate transport systems ATPase subunit|nr:ABC transporter ATP-binding protein [Bryobacteraceae bacterium]